MKIINKIRTLGLGFVLETVFDRVVPAWMFRFCVLAVYRLDPDKFPDAPLSSAILKTCADRQEREQLREITSDDTDQSQTIGILATVDGQVAGGLWIAIDQYEDADLGLSFSLPANGSWVYSARVDAEYRRRGIYSHLLAKSVRARTESGHPAPLIGVSQLNKGSQRAIQRFGAPVGRVLVIRIGSFVWTRATGDLKQCSNWTTQCKQRPVEICLP